MRNKRAFVTVLAALVVALLTVTPVIACEPPLEPGYSPGYWKHQCQVWVTGSGRYHGPWNGMELDALAASIMPGLTPEIAYDVFKDTSMKEWWLPLANAFNAAAGFGPYEGD